MNKELLSGLFLKEPLVPALGFLLGHIKGTHELKGVKNLVHKESDRLNEICSLLEKFSRKTEYSEKSDTLIIHGSEEKILTPVHLETAPDHRLVMSASLFLKYHSGGSIANPEVTSKSFHSFFNVCGI
jgi:5-enolpyruvylshikimate-3-phosphate synthase